MTPEEPEPETLAPEDEFSLVAGRLRRAAGRGGRGRVAGRARGARRAAGTAGAGGGLVSVGPADVAPCRRLGPDPTASSVAREAPPGSEPSPARFGRFVVRHELGRGAFGVVYLAYDPRLRREVALKVPRAEVLVTPELRARFRHEAMAAAGLDHPNIVPVYEAGEEGSVCFIASAYCPGITLAAWLRRRTRPVPYRMAAGLVATLAEAVEHAHRRGVLHRDLKPSNVLLEARRPGAPAGDGSRARPPRHRLRPGQAPGCRAGRGRRGQPDPERRHHGDAQLHGAGAGRRAGRRGRPRGRHL